MGCSNARILVIDDDESIRTMLALILEDEGFSIGTAQNGQEAVAKSNAEFYNLAIVDFKLPDVEGTELLLMLRETKPRMMKIMLTGYPTVQNAAEATKNGADAFMVKPADPSVLIGKIRELLKKQEENSQFGATSAECKHLN
jgi:DNA-binding NtrC family response regulator